MLLGGGILSGVVSVAHSLIALEPSPALATSIALGIVVMSVLDLRTLGTLKRPHRQTKVAFRSVLSLPACCLVWGFDIGLGVTTFRVSRLFWMMVAVAWLAGPPNTFYIALAYETSLLGVMIARSRRLTPRKLVDHHRTLMRVQARVALAGLALALYPLSVSHSL
jgi:hypothetical protein